MAAQAARIKPAYANPPVDAEVPASVPATIKPLPVTVTPSPVALGILQAETAGSLVAGAVNMATELAAVISSQKLEKMIRGRKHVKVEGWTTLGVMLGCVVREVSTTEKDGIYTSVVELIRMSDGACLGRASAECGANDEMDSNGKPIWSARPRYARRSMAQTRAAGKACRLAFSWIMTLAGYDPTPAEEMPIDGEWTPESSAPAPTPTTAQRTPTRINEVQHRMLEAKIKEYGLDRERVKAWMLKAGKVAHFTELNQTQFQLVLLKLEEWHQDALEVAKAEATEKAALEADKKHKAAQTAATAGAKITAAGTTAGNSNASNLNKFKKEAALICDVFSLYRWWNLNEQLILSSLCPNDIRALKNYCAERKELLTGN
ncbi:hypothetical protein CCP3SC15_550022 [Gammaproteobacteria bacterium]